MMNARLLTLAMAGVLSLTPLTSSATYLDGDGPFTGLKHCLGIRDEALYIGGGLFATKQTINLTIKALKRAKKATDAAYNANQAALLIAKEIEALDEIVSDIRVLFEPVPNIEEVLEDLSTFLEWAENDVVKPASDAIEPLVKEVDLAARSKNLQKAIDVLEFIKRPISPGAAFFVAAGAGVEAIAKVVNLEPAGACKETVRERVEAKCAEVKGSLDIFTKPVAQTKVILANVTDLIEEDLEPLLTPIETVEKPINDTYQAVRALNHDIHQIKALLRHHIKFKFAGIVVAHFTVHEILKDFKKIEHKAEKWLHITDAKKWLRHEVNLVMKPAIKSLRASLHQTIASIEMDGFNIADAKKAYAEMETTLKKMEQLPKISKELQGLEQSLKSAANCR